MAASAAASPSSEVGAEERVVGVDPGRSNIVFAVEPVYDEHGVATSFNRYILSRKRYNFEIGNAATMAAAARRHKGIEDVTAALSNAPPKTASLTTFLRHVQVWCDDGVIRARANDTHVPRGTAVH